MLCAATADLSGRLDLDAVGGAVDDDLVADGGTNRLAGLGAGLSARYVGSFEECGDPDGLSGAGGLCYVSTDYKRKVETYATFDAYVSYGFDSVAGKTSLTVGAQNLLDRDPAKVYNGFLASSDASTYDYMGRYMYARISQAF